MNPRYVLSACLLCAVNYLTAGPVYEPLASFMAAPQYPSRGELLPVPGEDAFFGLSRRGGGQEHNGTLYKVTKTGTVTTLLHFTGLREQYPGAKPTGGLWDQGNGWLWGTTAEGGNSDEGTVFKFHWQTRAFEKVVEFNLNNGAGPECSLVPDGAGYLWGTTVRGGLHNEGTVFRVRISDGAFASVISLSGENGPAPGSWPRAGLTPDGAGNLWGITVIGGSGSNGRVFKVHIASATFTSVVDIPANPALDLVNARLVFDGAGGLWGTAEGALFGAGKDGAVFKVNALTGAFTVVHEFNAAVTGSKPWAGLTDDGAGSFWGTTTEGLGGKGGAFKLVRSTGAVTSVAEFPATSGDGCAAPLTDDGAGNFWGTMIGGGPVDAGSIFKLTTRTRPAAISTVRVLDDTLSPARGHGPCGAFVKDSAGLLWSTTWRGGNGNNGTVFTCDPETGEIRTIVEFTGDGGTRPGKNPNGLMDAGNGWFWGSTSSGGAGYGTIFKVNPVTRAFVSAYSFTGTTGVFIGRSPDGRLVREGEWLWGATRAGGLANRGTVFKLHPLTGEFYTVYQWTGAVQAGGDNGPNGGLARDGAGSLWGVTLKSGSSGNGTVFKINSGIGTYSEVYNFTGTIGGIGVFPLGPLTADGNGRMWGVTNATSGLDSSGGTLYSIRISDGARNSYQPFSSLSGSGPGGQSAGGLLNDGSGSLWGVTRYGGAHSHGAIFRVPVSGASAGSPSWILPLSGFGWPAPGQDPDANPLTKGDDGHLYGALTEGGTAGYGQIFRLRYGPSVLTLPADNVGYTTAVLHGLVNPNGNACSAGFDIGVQPDLASPLPWVAGNTSAGTFYEPVTGNLTGLAPGTTYYFRTRASNFENPFPQTGRILSFTTREPSLADWLLGYGITGAAAAPTADPDGDGITNALEYLAGSNPSALSPRGFIDGSFDRFGYVASFKRADLSETPDISLTLEAGTDLNTWPWVYHIGATTAASSAGVTVAENGFAPDTIEVKLPSGSNRLVWRLKVTVTP